ncbi:MAG TPA: DUF4365 domain-containing protein [Gemmataceae bacterium]|nr:DUF4365 domain-containing protein [Gemmataceae bacterium]
MASQMLTPRKRRTRQHVIADLSVHHVERFILEEGHTSQRLSSDYGYDLALSTYNEQGYIEPGLVYFQLKASETWEVVGSAHVFDLDIRDYNLWMLEMSPVVLVLFDATRRRASWLAVQKYFRKNATRQPKKGAKTVRVQVPVRQVVNQRAIAKIRDLKWESVKPVLGVLP